ncbi:MAG: hydrolase [Gammaproteobacteria bacterium]|nr:hydrolase [Gammaproteobacteria bacterium]
MTVPLSMTVNSENSLFVVIDIQQRLMSAMPEQLAKAVLTQTGILLQAATSLTIPVMVTEQYPKGLGSTVEDLEPHLSAAKKIQKTCFSCADQNEFMSSLRASHRRQIILVGMEAHICVLQTALALLAQGFQVFVVEDAVCSRTQQNQTNALNRLRQAGVIVTNTESVLFEWLADAKHSEFKTLTKLIL